MSDDLINWSSIQSHEAMDVGRYFEYNEDALQLFKKWLNFISESSIKVLEIGSGNGFFTNILLKLFHGINLSCLEPDETFVNILKERFKDRIKIIKDEIESNKIPENTFDVIISHIVLHNLKDPIVALKKMKKITKTNGRIVIIEPLPSGKHYYPSEEVQKASEFLGQAIFLKATKRRQLLKYSNTWDPWNSCYPQFFQEIGLQNIRCDGWTSIFTLSDKRIDFKERKNWIKMRTNLVKEGKNETTQFLIQEGFTEGEINKSYSILLNYFKKLEMADEEELNKIHEQEIVHRIIIVGQK
ncbi:MAG: class I SAM-dependent methyltransferase [Promethearchaeota archaeon]|nr:MAG: class I SAM-dependent methyltransferase [Candidatus Lokiarchaeota archaeon]